MLETCKNYKNDIRATKLPLQSNLVIKIGSSSFDERIEINKAFIQIACSLDKSPGDPHEST